MNRSRRLAAVPTGRRRWVWSALAALVILSTAAGAEAHDAEMTKSGWLYTNPALCTSGQVTQNHGYHYIWTGAYSSNCQYGTKTQFAQYQNYYKAPAWGQPGTFCGSIGYVISGGGTQNFLQVYNWDIWSHFPCNNGFNVNVVLTIDSWQYAAASNQWWGGAWAPATAHCHCP